MTNRRRAPSRPALHVASTADAAKPRIREARRNLYRQAILEAAEKVFAEEGFEGAKMQHIASEAGISLGTLYGIFDGKTELYSAIQETRGAEMLEHVAQEAARGESVIDFVLAGIAAYVRFLVARPNYLRMHLRDGHAWGIFDTLKVVAQEEQWTRGFELLEITFARGIEEGVFVSLDPALMARITLATHQIWMAEWVEKSMSGDPAELVRAIQAHTLRAFCRPGVVTEWMAKLGAHE